MDTQATFFAILIDEWARGITDAVVCPGNRSTMLSALLEADARIAVHVMVDERSAAFFALGLGKATGKPAVFWCTSGTAAAEAHAAVIEANYARVPLLVCTANRPPEHQHVRDWQSIDQSRLYEGMTRWHFAPGVAGEAMRSSWRSIASRSVAETIFHPSGPGPVHLDLAIREPWTLEVGEVPRGREGDKPWHVHIAADWKVEAGVVVDIVQSGPRGVLVVGEGQVDADAVYIAAEALGWPVFAEARSTCRRDHPNCLTTYDTLLRSKTFFASTKPDVIVRIGTPSISKSLAQWTLASKAAEWLVDPYDDWSGSKNDSAYVLRAGATALCDALSELTSIEKESAWLELWQRGQRAAEAAINSVIEAQSQLTEPAVARALMRELDSSVNLFAGTSMPVRDVEAFSSRSINARVFANRGASGMDGLTSTAAGIAVATGRPTVFLTGDLSFLYDLNALWALNGVADTVNLTIVVMDNNGGGIFSTLPQLRGLDEDTFERVVATPQRVDIPAVAEALGVKVEQVRLADELMPAVRNAMSAGGIRVVYVSTERAENAALHTEIEAAVANALG